jgi:hypothetical protein
VIRVDIFPALLRDVVPGQHGERIVHEDEGSCFYHPAKKAITYCGHCGRFLCAMCDIELGGRHLCSGCVEAGSAQGNITELKNKYIRYDKIALALSFYALCIPWLTIFTGPCAVFVGIRFWKTPISILPIQRWRSIVAIMLGLVEMIAWGLLIFGMFSGGCDKW